MTLLEPFYPAVHGPRPWGASRTPEPPPSRSSMTLWLALDLRVPLALEISYIAACRSLRIPA
jgi:hypothetical protein